MQAWDGDASITATPRGGGYQLASCARGCRVWYTFALRDAARALDDRERGFVSGESIEAAPSTFLLRPLEAPIGTRERLHVTPAPGDAFACSLPRADASDTYAFETGSMYALPYAALGRVRTREVGPSTTLAELAPQFADEDALGAWARDDASAVNAFYGRMPERTLVIAHPTEGAGVGFGSTTGNDAAAIVVSVGHDSKIGNLHGDWTLVHELAHTALPNLADEHRWLEEGLASYLEPLIRARAGLVTPNAVWRTFVRGMPFGRPEAGDRGLDLTPTWGRTYWGGALFCFVADVQIREATHNAKSLDDALRAIVDAGGTIAVAWPIDRVIDAGDAGTGLHVLRDLYARWSRTAVDVDLDALFRRLGIAGPWNALSYDDHAELAAVRVAMTTR